MRDARKVSAILQAGENSICAPHHEARAQAEDEGDGSVGEERGGREGEGMGRGGGVGGGSRSEGEGGGRRQGGLCLWRTTTRRFV